MKLAILAVCGCFCILSGCEKKQTEVVYFLSQDVSAGDKLTIEMVDEVPYSLDSYTTVPLDIKDLTEGFILKGKIEAYLGKAFIKNATTLEPLKTEMFEKQ